ncbi:hypothetical protein BAnh1_07990 [Bartonella australis AUST/NH1]|uniref:Uncharacterized protein n=1 Tax=Bartonella australis (strain Aust/NH1) TaxID=1094489 RepID=M1NTN6_BARAA|nr:hypothetical protein [Bartonella australis]AGF74678.1 hypothetical protein BAnh1_07990 [Bartonella australis AUST/NH1]
MKSVFYFVLSVFWLLSIDQQSLAAELTIVQKTELSNLVIDINNAVQSGNFEVISANMPDRLYKEMARRLNTTEVALRSGLLKQLQDQFENLPVGAYRLDETKIDYRQTDNGTFYALIPTTLSTEDRIIQYKTLAIIDEAGWHLIYGGQKTVQNSVFLEIYPSLNGINLPKEMVMKK